MAVQFLRSPHLPLPAAADGVTITSNSTPWNNSSWVEIDPSIDVDALLLTIVAYTNDVNAGMFEVDIGVGSAGSEAVVSTIKGRSNPGSEAVGDDCQFNLPIAIEAFSSGDRIAARVRQQGAVASDWRVAIVVVESPYDGTLLTSANPVKVLPSATGFAILASGGVGWGNGAYTQLTASTGADWIVVGLSAAAGGEWEIDLATGAASSESVIGTVRGVGGATRHGQVMFPSPWDLIPSGSRVAARVRSSGGAAIEMAIMYQEAPL